MDGKVWVRRSLRDEILWGFHGVLEEVGSKGIGRVRFVWIVLRRFGVSRWQRARVGRRVLELLPEDLDRVDAVDMLAAFERGVPIEWVEDVRVVDAEVAHGFRGWLLSALSEAPQPLPKELARRIRSEIVTRAIVAASGVQLDDVERDVRELLTSQLWRCNDAAAHEQLLEDVLYVLRKAAKVAL